MKSKLILVVGSVAAAASTFSIGRVDEKRIIFNCIGVAASIIFALLPSIRSRVRATWANAVFITVGIVGVLVAGTELTITLNWVAPAKEPIRTIHQNKALLNGFALGMIASLILSQQLLGGQRSSLERRGATA